MVTKPDNIGMANPGKLSEEVLSADICRIVMMHTPTLFVTETCEIIDVSEKFRSCCADNASRTFFLDIMKEESIKSFSEFCSENVSGTKVFSIYYRRYRYAVAAKISGVRGGCNMISLSENLKGAMLLVSFFSGRMTSERFDEHFRTVSNDSDVFSSSVKLLTNPYNEMDEWESTAYLRGLSSKLTLRSDMYPYTVKFTEEERARSHRIRVHSGGLSIIFTCALSVLGPISKSGELSVEFDTASDSYAVTVTAKLPYDIKLRGETDRITSLGGHLSGSFPYLLLAELAAVQTDMFVKVRSEEQSLSFVFGSRELLDSSPTFNYRDTETDVENVVCTLFAVLDVLLESINKQKYT